MSDLHTFNPVRQAMSDQRGFQQAVARRFSKLMCWSCQKEVLRTQGTETLMNRGGIRHDGGGMRKFVCFSCSPRSAA